MGVVNGGSPDVFVINDVNLKVPPTNIAVSKEDLIWNWRTLRSASATKIPSGHGQTAITVTIPFTPDLFLELHRLTVQLRNSPFCFIDNRYLRQMIVPDWPINQNMAFTMTSLNLNPLQGSSDTWIMKLELLWFNYLPFTPNFLYREDWNTEWIAGTTGLGSQDPYGVFKGSVKYSIGWTFDPATDARVSRVSVVDLSSDLIGEVPRWSNVYQDYSTKVRRTIDDMEVLHEGQIFDLLPMPGNMEPSRFVYMPEDSRIYKRYSNYLQRDALMKNFDVDVEQDLLDYGGEALRNRFFAAIKQDGRIITDSLASAPSILTSKWIQRMLERHHWCTFVYDIYKDVRLPKKFTDKFSQNAQKIYKTYQDAGVSYGQDHQIDVHDKDGNVIRTATIRNGFSRPDGKYIPTWDSVETLINHFNDNQRVRVRSAKEVSDIYGEARGERVHEGVDIKTRDDAGVHQKLPVYAVEDGYLIEVGQGSKFNVNRWKVINVSNSQLTKSTVQPNSPQFTDLINSLIANGLVTDTLEPLKNIGTGTVVRSSTNPDLLYFQDQGDGGQYVVMEHFDCSATTPSISKYLHLSEISVRKTPGATTPIAKGTLLGYTGGTSDYNPAYIAYVAQEQTNFRRGSTSGITKLGPNAFDLSGNPPELVGINPFVLSPHLHFEYYEPKTVEQNPKKDAAKSVGYYKETDESHVLVDVTYSYKISTDKSGKQIVAPPTIKPDEELLQKTADDLKASGEFSEQEYEDLLQLFQALFMDGWKYYEGDHRVLNVWYKRPVHTVYKSKVEGTAFINSSAGGFNIAAAPVTGNTAAIDGMSQLYRAMLNGKAYSDPIQGTFIHDDCVLTSVAGGFRHIVASLPILSHEFPTHQHLGSIEPMYSLEFAVLDDYSAGQLDGIGLNGELIETMRAKLQSNARNFRVIPNGASLVTDTFITRFLGTTSTYDYIRDDRLASGDKVTKRSIIASDVGATVEGHPGLSRIVLTIEETNSYDPEKIVSTSPNTKVIDEARKKMLAALYSFDSLISDVRDPEIPLDTRSTLTVYIAQQLGVGYQNPVASFSHGNNNFVSVDSYGNQLIHHTALNGGGGVFLRLSDSNGELAKLLAKEGLLSSDFETGSGYIEVRVDKLEELLGFQLDQKEGTFSVGSGYGTQYLDFSFAFQNTNLGAAQENFDVNHKAYEYHKLLTNIMLTAEMILAEEELGGFHQAYIDGELYDLPVKNCQWQLFQDYFQRYIQLARYPGTETALSGGNGRDTNYLTAERVSVTPDPLAIKIADEAAEYFYGYANNSKLWLIYNVPNDIIERSLKNLVLTADAEATASNIETVRYNFASQYVGFLPITNIAGLPSTLRVSTWLEDKIQYVTGDLLSANKPPAFMQLLQDYVGYLNSNNLLFFTEVQGNQVYIATPGRGYLNIDGTIVYEENVLTQRDSVHTDNLIPLYGLASSLGDMLQTGLDATGSSVTLPGQGNVVEVGGEIGAASQYPVNRDAETAKIRYLKQILTTLADECLQDADLLEFFKLQDLANIDFTNNFIGTECYPDLKLPFHPYYESIYQTNPDFYFWNVYEDGGAFSQPIQDEIYSNLAIVVDNSYQSLKGFEPGQLYDPGKDPVISEVNADDLSGVNIRISAEGSDAVLTKTSRGIESMGHMGSPFAQPKEALEAESNFYNRWPYQDSREKVSSTKPPLTNEGIVDSVAGALGTQSPSYNIKLGVSDGSLQYPLRVAPSTYEELWNKIGTQQKMFGNKAGYLGEEITDENVSNLKSKLTDTKVAVLDEYVHGFSPDSLQKLARDSSKDLLSQKMTMRRAVPTFKLMFVEEDEFESRFLNFDDFYSFSGVKEFTVVQSRQMAADLAIITLQNVSGVLDGTARGVVTDADYFDKKKIKKIEDAYPDISPLAETPEAEGTVADQPFGALVLRPGLNVQLRCGYSNDPTSLEVLISGRIVDLSWNQTGDLVEIQVQSFGVELEQILKGTDQMSGAAVEYATTHQLLGSMMLSPELAHFGRWEFGQLFQIGESKDSRIDFFDYSREGFLGRFKATNFITRWMYNHPYIVAGVAVGLSALQFLPVGKGTGVLNKVLGKFAGGKSIPFIEREALEEGLTLALREGDDIAEVGAKALAKQNSARQVIAGAFSRYTDDIVRLGAGQDEIGSLFAQLDNSIVEAVQTGQLGDLLSASNKLEVLIQGKLFAGNWLGVSTFAPVSLTWFGQSGKAIFGKTLATFIGPPLKLTGSFVATGLLLDALNYKVIQPLYDHTIGNAKKFFARTQSSLFLSPQDDNLYPPSPKDYMSLETETWFGWLATNTLKIGGRLVFSSDELGNVANRFFNPDIVLEKRVSPQQCGYRPIGVSIFDIFHEMTLRHPGWIYGARPYGRDFRYTMFFGVPSQRYWSKPAPNRFIARMNDLHRALEDGKLDEVEYNKLYGSTLPDGTDIEVFKQTYYAKNSLDAFQAGDETAADAFFQEQIARQSLIDTPNFIEVPYELEKVMTARAIEEYLKGLELRFVPFRRYHTLTSYRDIIQNGVISSESEVVNAVDVGYTQDPDQLTAGSEELALTMPYATELIKANSTIPESMVKIKPVFYPNCKGYTMALRYGMGELIYSMKEMYRGEILLLGNPRIKPWDIGIVIDTYNDMTGPVEIEQVVHTFSHETGFITEIKPNAVVIGNEISSYPMIEAMKMFALAVQDMERNFGAHGNDPGNALSALVGSLNSAEVQFGQLKDALGYQSNEEFDTLMERKYRSIFGKSGAQLSRDGFGGKNPPSQPVDSLIEDAEGLVDGGVTATGLLTGGGLAALGTVVTGNSIYSSGTLLNKQAAFGVGVGAVGGALVAGALYMHTNDYYDAPTLAFMIGGPIIISKMMREDAVVVVPLIKNGNPIVAGLSFHDPSMIWSSFLGKVRNYADDAVSGTRDVLDLYNRYGTAMWRELKEPSFGEIAEAAFYGDDLTENR